MRRLKQHGQNVKQIGERYEDVLYRPQLRIPCDDANIVMDAIRLHGERGWPVASIGFMPDEDDRVFYDAAKSAGAYLITGNTKHYPHEPFILTPTELFGVGKSLNCSPRPLLVFWTKAIKPFKLRF